MEWTILLISQGTPYLGVVSDKFPQTVYICNTAPLPVYTGVSQCVTG